MSIGLWFAAGLVVGYFVRCIHEDLQLAAEKREQLAANTQRANERVVGGER